MLNKTSFGFVASGALIVLATGMGTSCSRNESASPQRPPVSDSNARSGSAVTVSGAHSIQNAKIRDLMQRMARDKAEKSKDLPDDPESAGPFNPHQVFADAVTLADLLAQTATDIPKAIADRPITQEKRIGFTREADALRRHALEFKEAALVGKVEQMQRALDRIDTSCINCHNQYRDIAGVLKR